MDATTEKIHLKSISPAPGVDSTTEGLKEKVLQGGGIVFIGQICQNFISLISVYVLAKLLTPEDYGLLAMVLCFTAFLQIFSDLGLSAATVQAKTINHEQLSTLFWLNVVCGLFLTTSASLASPIIVWFYKEPRLLSITLWLAWGFVISGVGIQHAAIIQRKMAYGKIAISSFISVLVSASFAILAAFLGFGYYALIIQILCQSTTKSLLCIILSGWKPSRPRLSAGSSHFLKFSGYYTGFTFLNYFTMNLDNVIIGRFFGAQALGYYTFAYRLYMLPITLLNQTSAQVMLPALSIVQGQKDRFNKAFLSFLAFLIVTSCSLSLWMSITSEQIIMIFGDRWRPAIPLLSVLAVSGAIRSLFNGSGVGFLASGNTRLLFLFSLFATPCYICAFLIGSMWNTYGVAVGYAICAIICSPIGLLLLFQKLGLSFQEIMMSIRFPVLILITSSLVLYICAIILERFHYGIGMECLILFSIVLLFHFLLIWKNYSIPHGTLKLGDLQIFPIGKKILHLLTK